MLQLAVVPDGTNSEEDITAAVRGLHSGIAGEISGMRAEHLNMWLREFTQENKPERTKLEASVSMTQLIFWEDSVLEQLTWPQ